MSSLDGSLDHALEQIADHLTAAFGVDGCLISLRGDSTGGSAATGTRTWSQLVWSQTAERCRQAAQRAETLVAPSADAPDSYESYLAVPLDSALGAGFVGLVVQGERVFDDGVRRALQGIAARLAIELAWRAAHENAAQELDRRVNGPGLDHLLGTWNQAAVRQLAAMQVSAARRSSLALAILVLDVVDLNGLNGRFGLDVGDRVLRRVADCVRATVREEDVVGRWSGDELAIVLHGTDITGAVLVAKRLRAAVVARPLELAEGGSLSIDISAGVATLLPADAAIDMLTRAARAASRAQELDVPVLTAEPPAATSSGSIPLPRVSQQLEVADEDVATTLGGTYRLLHEISRGGMGVVYRAEDRALERSVAIKMLRSDLADDPALVEAFRAEAAMLAHIQHPNLVQIYNFGHSGDDSYFVMELVEGESLEQAYDRHRAEGSQIAPADIAVAIEQVAAALDALHDRGVVHRDVKPANVIRDPFRSRTVLVDVGIARRYGQHATSAGTPGFVAPEIFADQEASARSDVYGLAATAYTALTLQRPFGDGELVAILARQLDEEMRAPSELRPELAPVDELLMKALSKDPARRPASAGAFARELSVALASAAGTTDSEQSQVRRRPRAERATVAPASVPAVASARTRGVVFRSVSRALGARDAGRLRDAIGGNDPDLARALHEAAPQEWMPSHLFVRLLTVAPDHVGRDRTALAREIGRATVRSSFRRFFPSSSATLAPERTLSAIRNVWARYQTWGIVSSMPVSSTQVVVQLIDPLPDPALCAWTSGMLEQLVLLSGGRTPLIGHETCATCGEDACLFRVTWERAS